MTRIAITGSSGLIGSALAAQLAAGGHEVVPVLRGAQADPKGLWDPATGWIREDALDGCAAVVHLAGASIGEGRWTAARRKELRESRIEATRLLVGHLRALKDPPKTLVSASAVGYYGDRGDEVMVEESAPGSGFLAELVRDWEQEALNASDLGIRTAVLRFGVIISRQGGALGRMLLPFRLGVGGRLGSGRQWMSWISLDDAAGVIEHAIVSNVDGPLNAAAPEPVTNRTFTAELARTLRRPAIFPIPGLALRLAFDGMADEMLLASQRVDSGRLVASGYAFRHATIGSGLAAALEKAPAP
jgi:hypothetical protein